MLDQDCGWVEYGLMCQSTANISDTVNYIVSNKHLLMTLVHYLTHWWIEKSNILFEIGHLWISKVLSRAIRPIGRRWSPFHSPKPDTSRSRKTTDTGPAHRVVCPFTPQLSLVLINRPRRDGTLSWRWYTAAVGGIRTRNREGVVGNPAPYHSATAYLCE